MCCEKDEADVYKATIDNSKEISLQKAIAIFIEEQEKNAITLKRPEITPRRGIIKISVVVMLLGIIGALFAILEISFVYLIVLAFFIVAVEAKKTIVWLILLYQKYAPERLRKSCVFEPTCSNYMLMAIDKYGLVKGVVKGIIRLIRCHPPNGGIDNP